MNKAKLLSELDDLTDIEADFQGWICYSNRYDPADMGYDLVVEILELNLESVDSKRAKDILRTEVITAAEQKDIKSYVLEEVRRNGEESYWIGDHPNAIGKVFVGFYQVYHKVHSSPSDYNNSGHFDNEELSGETLEQFRGFLRSLVMHGAVGTALGGVCTIVGEPQNLLIGDKLGWDFMEFFYKMAPITLPVLAAGLLTCALLEVSGKFGFGEKLPALAKNIIQGFLVDEDAKRSKQEKYALVIQASSAVFLIVALAFHLAPVGLIGLTIIVLQTALTGITDEHRIGHAFEEALPFTALLAVFFVIVGMIHDLHLFKPIIQYVLEQDKSIQPALFYTANGVLSMISDNVFVATVYINEVKAAFDSGLITRKEFETLAIAINTGTNLPSVATPNGQAAFLFLLTSALAPAIRLSYIKMIWMALPYTIVLGLVGLMGVVYFL